MKRFNLCKTHKQYLEAIDTIQTYIQQQDNRIDGLTDRLQEYSKDEELQRLHNEIDRLHKNSIYILSDKESESEKKFKEKHYQSCKNGNDFEYRIISTGVGDAIKIKCPKCMTVEDISDYEW